MQTTASVNAFLRDQSTETVHIVKTNTLAMAPTVTLQKYNAGHHTLPKFRSAVTLEPKLLER